MNVYDVALDFILLDAFDELNNPPAALLNVLQNRWLTDNMKISVSRARQRAFLVTEHPP